MRVQYGIEAVLGSTESTHRQKEKKEIKKK